MAWKKYPRNICACVAQRWHQYLLMSLSLYRSKLWLLKWNTGRFHLSVKFCDLHSLAMLAWRPDGPQTMTPMSTGPTRSAKELKMAAKHRKQLHWILSITWDVAILSDTSNLSGLQVQKTSCRKSCERYGYNMWKHIQSILIYIQQENTIPSLQCSPHILRKIISDSKIWQEYILWDNGAYLHIWSR